MGTDRENKNKLFLLDAYALIFRAYYAFIKNPRINSKGLNTSAIFGFLNTLDELLQKENPSHIAVVFDPPTPNFRHELFEAYKANREATPEDIKKSVPHIKELLHAFNIPVIEIPGFEADDVIGTLAKQAEKENFSVFMVTPDKDFAQLVTENIYMYKPRKGGNDAEIWGPEQVQKNFSIKRPEQVVEILALWGDTADNIPGAPGVGEKTSKRLIEEFGSLSELFNQTEKLKGKLKENIENNKDQIELSKTLATISTEAPVEFNSREFQKSEPDKNRLKSLFDELEFRTIAKRFFDEEEKQELKKDPVQASLFDTSSEEIIPIGAQPNNITNVKHRYVIADTPEKVKETVDKFSPLKEFCFDTETTGLDVLSAEMVGIALCAAKNEAVYIPIPEEAKQRETLLNLLRPLFENSDSRKIGQNIKYDIQILINYGIRVSGNLFDTMLAHYLIQPERRHNLNYLAASYLEYSPIEIEQLIGPQGKLQKSMNSVPLEKIAEYACEDTDITLQLKEIFEKELVDHDLVDLAEEIEMPLIQVLADMERSGVKLDKETLKQYATVLQEEIIALEKEIYHLSGTEFNIGSPKQLGEVLFERLKIVDNPKRTKTKQYSTSEDVLSKLKEKHPVVPLVLDHRSYKKLLSTYVEVLPGLVHPKSGKIHTSFNQAVAATGRLSSNNPNLQNIPIREERGREIRKAFIPTDDNHILFSADYSQIELRLMAHMSGDNSMIESFLSEEYIHRAT
jgi:DNA polymerase-1